MNTYAVIVGVVKFKEKILILKRIPNNKFSPNLWEHPSGFIKEHESAEDATIREVKEETRLEGRIIKSGKVFEASDKWGRWVIVPYLVSVNSDEVKIDPKEHCEFKWIKPREINNFKCVIDAKKDLKTVGL